jgi:hypothetical protein
MLTTSDNTALTEAEQDGFDIIIGALTELPPGDQRRVIAASRAAFGLDAKRSPNRFRERELARAVRVTQSAGGGRVEIDPITGKISVVIGKKGESPADNEVEEWLSKQQGQHENQR